MWRHLLSINGFQNLSELLPASRKNSFHINWTRWDVIFCIQPPIMRTLFDTKKGGCRNSFSFIFYHLGKVISKSFFSYQRTLKFITASINCTIVARHGWNVCSFSLSREREAEHTFQSWGATMKLYIHYWNMLTMYEYISVCMHCRTNKD